MKLTGSIVLFYALIVLSGGLMGYLIAGSLPSLVAGSVFGALLFASGLGLFRYSKVAFLTALISTASLVIFFGYRYFNTFQMMPSGMMLMISIAIILLLLTTKGQRPTHS